MKRLLSILLSLILLLSTLSGLSFKVYAAVDTNVYKPDIQLQFGTLFNADININTWVDNFSDGPIETMGRGAKPNFKATALCGPILAADTSLSKTKAKLTVKGLTIEAADTANYDNDDLDLTPLTADYSLKKGDAFTVTIRMDNVSSVYVATAEISYSGNIEPLYFTESGSGLKYKSSMGSAAQGLIPNKSVWGKEAFPYCDPQYLYSGINADEIGSELRTDYNGENYMYAEIVAPEVANWSITEYPYLTNEDGTFGNKYENKSIMATFAFLLKEDLNAENPIYFWVHNGDKDGHGIAEDGSTTFTGFSEGNYTPTIANSNSACATTYATNKYASIDNQFNGVENFGSKKMTFMGVNQNIVAHTPKPAVRENAVLPTCTMSGSYDEVVYCSECGEELSRETIEVSALDHDFCEWTVSALAIPETCTTAGKTKVETRTCSRCDYTESRGGEEIPALGHDYKSVVTAPTCTEQGYTTYTCSRCKDTYKDNYIDALGHAEVIDEAVAVTCTTDGNTEGKHCSRCNAVLVTQETIKASGHIVVIDEAVEETCTEKGKTEGKHCSVCGEILVAQRDIDAKGHLWGAWSTTTLEMEATCTESGATKVEERRCLRINCDATDTRGGEEIPALGHAYSSVVTAPACTEKGFTTYTCSVCGDVYKDNYVDATGHTEVIDAGIAATCTEGGKTEGKHCSVCNAVLVAQENTVPLGHNYNKVVVDPTCEEQGYTIYTCSLCGDSYVSDYVSSTGEHVWDSGVITKAAKCTENGSITYSCRICHTTKTEELTAIGHVPTTQVTPATASMNGSLVSRCINCNIELSRSVIYCPQTVTLSATKYTYDGKEKKPSVKVTDSNGKVISSSNYSVTYASGRKEVGRYSVKLDFKGNYSGSITKTFDIVPKATSLKSAKSVKKKAIQLVWSKVAGVSGYEVQVSTDKNFKKGIKSYTAASKYTKGNVNNLKGGKKYFVRIRTFKTVKYGGKSVKLYSAWSKAKSAKTKK